MFDGMNPRLHGFADAIDPMRVRRHAFAEFCCFLHGDADLIRIEVRCSRQAVFHQHRTRDSQLDEVGAVLDLFACALRTASTPSAMRYMPS